MAFAGSDPYGIFSGTFNSGTKVIHWGATAEAGSHPIACLPSLPWSCRVMSFAACDGKLYASIYDAIVVRTDGANPSWQTFFRYYSGPALNPGTSGFRGLTCVPNLNGQGSMLIAALEGNSPDVYDIPLDGSQPTIELHTANYLSSRLVTWIGYGIAAYDNMIVYPQSGTPSCPDLLIGLGLLYAGNFATSFEDYYPTALYLVRHCNGVYDLRKVVDPSIVPAPPLLATRALVVTHFSGDPAGTLYAGGYDANNWSAHNTDWIYQGDSQLTNPSSLVAPEHRH